jgi:molybdenum cofactor biosynthesis protein MoaC
MVWPDPMASRCVYAFEGMDEALLFMPLAARRLLDVLGRKLSLEGWRSLSLEDRRRVVREGAAEQVDPAAAAIIDTASPVAENIHPQPDPDPRSIPQELAATLGGARRLDSAQWRALRALDRYALVKCASKPDKLVLARDEIGGVLLTHLTQAGDARMVDVGDKAETARRAVASACVRTTRSVVEAIAAGAVAKGDVLAAARVAGILAAKRTPELVPLCHAVRTTYAAIDFEPDAEHGELRVRATVEAIDRTGVEMEAMVAASVASLTVYDMVKSADRWATIDAVRLDAKSGGKSGDVKRPPERGGP